MELLGYSLLLLLSFYLLAKICDDYFVEALEKIAVRFRMSNDMAGATLMAVGSSAPELAISLIAVFGGGQAETGAGTIVGSALFNILVIIGVSAIVRKAVLNWQPVVRDNLFYFASVMWLLISFWDQKIVLYETVVFVVLYLVYLVAVWKWKVWFPYEEYEAVDSIEEDLRVEVGQGTFSRLWSRLTWPFDKVLQICFMPFSNYLLTFGWSVVLISALSFVLVHSGEEMAHILDVPPAIVALTILAAGTSVPDLMSSIIVARKGKGGMAISNAVGSNIFDILVGLGIPWFILLMTSDETSVYVDNDNLLGSVILLLATIVATFFIYISSRWEVGRKGGWVLVVCYLSYLVYQLWQVLA